MTVTTKILTKLFFLNLKQNSVQTDNQVLLQLCEKTTHH